MTTPVKTKESAPLAMLGIANTFGVFKHLMSPLEEAALQHAYKPFHYSIHGHQLYVSAWACNELMESTRRKFQTLELLEYQDRHCTALPLKHREAFFDPGVILSLPPRLRNRLCRLGCYSLFAIMQKGKTFFKEEQGFTSHALRLLDQEFEKFEAKHLFQ